MSSSSAVQNEREEFDSFAALTERVRAGEPVHVNGPATGALARLNLALIEWLKLATGLPVHVIYD